MHSTCLSAKNESPTSESYPATFNSKFWLNKQFCTICATLGKCPLPAHQLEQCFPHCSPAPLMTLTKTEVLRGGMMFFHRPYLPHSDDWHRRQHCFLAVMIKKSPMKLSMSLLHELIEFDIADDTCLAA